VGSGCGLQNLRSNASLFPPPLLFDVNSRISATVAPVPFSGSGTAAASATASGAASALVLRLCVSMPRAPAATAGMSRSIEPGCAELCTAELPHAGRQVLGGTHLLVGHFRPGKKERRVPAQRDRQQGSSRVGEA